MKNIHLLNYYTFYNSNKCYTHGSGGGWGWRKVKKESVEGAGEEKRPTYFGPMCGEIDFEKGDSLGLGMVG